jgi:hypothetical protein
MTVTVNSIGEYLEKTQLRSLIPARLSNGIWSYYCYNSWVDEETFQRLYPPVEYIKPYKSYGDNPDSSKSYLSNRKSY